MVFEDVPNTGLTLGSISTDENPKNHSRSHHHRHQHNKKLLSQLKFDHVFPSDLTLGLSSSSSDEKLRGAVKIGVSKFTVLCPPQASSLSAASSYSNSSVKRERYLSGEEEEDVEVKILEIERVSSKASDDQDEEEGSARKKLRLTKEQSVVLEDNFKQHSTLNPKLKQALAKQLNLRPRQVEVWFQNRRARKKLKQNETECELLKKSWETLKDENKRLQKELQELKALSVTAPFYVRIPTSTFTMCPSCERVGGNGGDSIGSDDGNGDSSGSSSSKMIPFSIGAKAADFYNPITHPSAAC